MDKLFEIGQLVSIDFIGTITGIHMDTDGKKFYTVQAEPDKLVTTMATRVYSDNIYRLPTPEDFQKNT